MKKSQKKALAVGAGVAVLAVAAAGAYLMSNKSNRRKVKAWMGKMQKEVIRELGGVKKASQAAYNKAVDAVAKNYRQLKTVDPQELTVAANQLKRHWRAISKEVKSATGTVKRLAPARHASRSEAGRPKARKVARKAVSKSRSRKKR